MNKVTEARKPNFLLRYQREWLSLSQRQVAEYIGTTTLSVSRWERGIVLPGPHFRRALCSLFNKNPCELGFMSDERGTPEKLARNSPISTESRSSHDGASTKRKKLAG